MNTKSILKYLKLNEGNISMILGALVIVALSVIVINYFRGNRVGEIDTGANTESPTATEQPIVQRGEGPVEYTVTQNESLWSISEKQYGTGYNWTDISQANNLKNPNYVEVGQKLVIPDVEPKIASAKTSENSEMSEQISGSTYIVRRGDSLWNIALRAYDNGDKWVKIAEENNLVNPSFIHSGNVLAIPR
jgi:nucleoid-associated protein YgaU